MAATELPLVYLAFANAEEAHLSLLKHESREVFRALQPLQEFGKIDVHREESSEFNELYEDLLTHGDRLVIFHYGGHANGQMLALEGGGGNSVGLARLLGQQNSLKLVFLNGCATQGHVALLLDAGVPAVIATSVPIGDQKAQEFSSAFYAALAEGRSVPQAFESSRGFVEGRYGVGGGAGLKFTRAVNWTGKTPESPVLEWGLFTREDCADDLGQWRLPDAQAQWRVQLVDARGPLRNLDGDPQPIEHRLPVRTVPAVVCNVCRTTSTAPSGKGAACPVCGSNDIERSSARTAIAEQVLPFAVSADQARDHILKHLGNVDKNHHQSSPAIRLEPLFLPYWVLDVDTRTTVEAERGSSRDLGEVVPKLEWEPVRDVVDLARHAFLVQAGFAPVSDVGKGKDWYWELDRAEPLKRLDDLATASVVLDRSLQSGFDRIASDLDSELAAQVRERVGGQQQRNVLTDTRYRSVAARAVLLPHLYATVEKEGGRTGLIVNGQTGAVRPLRLPGAVDSQDAKEMHMSERTYEPIAQPPGQSLAVSVFSGVGIGLMVGIMLGLAAPSGDGKSLVGYFIAAVGAGLAAILGLNDAHFSTAKGLRIGAFGLAVLVAAPAGIFIREHKLLSPSAPIPLSLSDRKAAYIALGYNEAEALVLLKQWIETDSSNQAGAGERRLASAGGVIPSALMSGEVADRTLCDKLTRPADDEEKLGSEDVILNFKLAGSPQWTNLAEQSGRELQGDDQKKILFIARDAVCKQRVKPTAEQCKALKTAEIQSEQALQTAFVDAALQPLLKNVEDRNISVEGRAVALRMLTGVICKPG